VLVDVAAGCVPPAEPSAYHPRRVVSTALAYRLQLSGVVPSRPDRLADGGMDGMDGMDGMRGDAWAKETTPTAPGGHPDFEPLHDRSGWHVHTVHTVHTVHRVHSSARDRRARTPPSSGAVRGALRDG